MNKDNLYYVVAHYQCGSVPLGIFTKDWAEFIAKQHREKEKFNPLFEKVTISH
jgi:hypothetical protein